MKGGEHLIRSITPEDKKQRDEIKKLEQQIKIIQASEKKVKKETQEVSWTTKHFLKFWGVGMLTVFVGYIFFQSLTVIYLILAAYIVSIAVEAIIDLFQRARFSRGRAITLTYFFLAIFLLSGFVLIAPFLFNQITEVLNILIIKVNSFQTALETKGLVEVLKSSGLLSNYVKKEVFHNFSDPQMVLQIQSKIQTSISTLSSTWTNYAQVFGNLAVNFFTGFASFCIQAGIVITLAVLFSIEKVSMMKFVASLGGEKKYKYLYIKLEKIYKQLGIWLKSRLLLSLYIGLAMYGALWLASAFGMDIPNKASLALILGLLDIVPYFGPFIGGIPAVLGGFTDFGVLGGSILIGIVFLINTIESNVLIPIIMNRSLGISPIIIFISMILGGLVMGFVGILLAVPIAAIITLMFEKDEASPLEKKSIRE